MRMRRIPPTSLPLSEYPPFLSADLLLLSDLAVARDILALVPVHVCGREAGRGVQGKYEERHVERMDELQHRAPGERGPGGEIPAAIRSEKA